MTQAEHTNLLQLLLPGISATAAPAGFQSSVYMMIATV